MKDDRWLICPICGWNKKYKTTKKMSLLNKVDLTSGPFIDHRDMSGGRGSGFDRLYMETLPDIVKQKEYKNLLVNIKKRCEDILKILETVEEEQEEYKKEENKK